MQSAGGARQDCGQSTALLREELTSRGQQGLATVYSCQQTLPLSFVPPLFLLGCTQSHSFLHRLFSHQYFLTPKVHMTLHLFLVLPGAQAFLAKVCYSIWKEQGINLVQPSKLFLGAILAFLPSCSESDKEDKEIHMCRIVG